MRRGPGDVWNSDGELQQMITDRIRLPAGRYGLIGDRLAMATYCECVEISAAATK